MPESSDSDHIGRIGEGAFNQLADKARLLIGKIDPDRIGKDRVIEFELSERSDLQSFDKRKPPLKCAIQIKSVNEKTERVKLALSVAERLIGDPIATFIAILRIDEQDEVVEFRMLHLLGEPMKQILKRLRQEYAEGTEKLNEHETTFKIDSADVVEFKPAALVGYLERSIGSDIEEYAAAKATQRNTAGYDPDQRLTLQTTFGSTSIEDFVDGMLGLKPVPVLSIKAFEERFSIKLPDHSIFPQGFHRAAMEFTPTSSTRGLVALESVTTQDRVELEAEIFLPAIPNLPVEHLRIRIKTRMLEILIGRGKIDFSSGATDWADIHYLSDWMEFIGAWKILSSGECRFELKNVAGQTLVGAGKTPQAEDDSELIDFFPVLERFAKIRDEAGVADRPISLKSVYEASHAINQIDVFFSAPNCGGEFLFDFETNSEDSISDLTMLLITSLTVGEEKYAAALKLELNAEKSAELLKCRSTKAEALSIESFSDEDTLERFRSKLLRISGCQHSMTYWLQEREAQQLSERLYSKIPQACS